VDVSCIKMWIRVDIRKSNKRNGRRKKRGDG